MAEDDADGADSGVDGRAEAVLADAREALTEGSDDDGVAPTPRLRAVAEAAAALVEEADSDALLAAVGLGGEDGYDGLTEALAEGDADRVRDLEGLLTLSTLAEEWDDPEAADHRADLADLFGVGAGDGSGDGDGESSDGADAEGTDPPETDDPTESDADDGASAQEDDDDDDGLLERVVDEAPDEGDVVVEAVERLAPSASGDEADDGDGADDEEEEPAADESDGAVDDLFADAVERFRSGIDRAREDLDAFGEEAGSDSEEGAGGADGQRGTPAGRARRLSTVPDRGRSPTHHSTVPDRN